MDRIIVGADHDNLLGDVFSGEFNGDVSDHFFAGIEDLNLRTVAILHKKIPDIIRRCFQFTIVPDIPFADAAAQDLYLLFQPIT
ncbi:MAG: hypothetical protein JAZ02_16665 [Candidatus Thiodiazotropha endolucinida]|nr:hypothetical protein [Candidatus Thiodiazotropha endolucinida]